MGKIIERPVPALIPHSPPPGSIHGGMGFAPSGMATPRIGLNGRMTPGGGDLPPLWMVFMIGKMVTLAVMLIMADQWQIILHIAVCLDRRKTALGVVDIYLCKRKLKT